MPGRDGQAAAVQESGKTGHLRTRRRCRIGGELTSQLLLQRFDTLDREASHAPEQMDTVRRGVEDIGRRRQITTGRDSGHDGGPAMVGIEEHVTNGANGRSPSGDLPRADRIDAGIYYVELGTRLLTRADHAVNAAVLGAYVCNRAEDRTGVLSFSAAVEKGILLTPKTHNEPGRE